jgi:hypothetical protein
MSGEDIKRGGFFMKKLIRRSIYRVFGTVACVMALISSCATTQKITVTNPPEWDVSGVKRVGVVSFAPGKYDGQIAKDLTAKALEIILSTKRFDVITPEETRRLLGSNQSLSAQMDAVLTGSVDGFSTKDSTSTSKDSAGKETITYIREAELTCTLRLERASDRSIINQKTLKNTTSGSASSRAELPSADQLSKKMISAKGMDVGGFKVPSLAIGGVQLTSVGILDELPKLVAPWTSEEKLKFKDDKTKDPQMAEADKALKDGNTKQAQRIWKEVYEKTQNIAAGYNEALVTQVLGDLSGAIQLMQKVYDDTGNPDARIELERMRALADKQNIVAEKYTGNASSTMDKAIEQAVSELQGVLTKNSKVAFIVKPSKSKDAVEHSVGEVSRQLINAGITVIDRSDTRLIQREQQFQVSGDVSDDSAVSLGKILGVNTMVISSVTGEGVLRRLEFKAISVETSRILRLVSIQF